jgi:hypothetical protein
MIPGHLDAYDLLRLSSQFQRLVSMRLHPALLAAAQGVPSVLAMSDHKVSMLDGTPMRRRVMSAHDAAGAETAARMAISDTEPTSGRDLLGHLWRRLDVNRKVLADLLAVASAPGR